MTATRPSVISRTVRAKGAQAVGMLGKAGANYLRYGTFGSVTIDPPNIAANTTADVSATIPGITTANAVALFPPAALEAGLVFGGCRITGNNTLSVRVGNVTVAAINGAARSWGFVVLAART